MKKSFAFLRKLIKFGGKHFIIPFMASILALTCFVHGSLFYIESNHKCEQADTALIVKTYIKNSLVEEVDSYIQPLKDWMAMPSTLEAYNERLFKELWNKHAEGSVSHWNMEALCYYDDEHELEHVNEKLYGIVNFFELPEEPEPYEWYTRYINGQPKAIPKYKISRIAGTVLNADNNHHMVTVLTKYGSVNVKMNKGHYSFYNKTISEVGEDGKKKRIEESWLKRGNLITCQGIRRGDQFVPMIYNDTIYKHTVNLIKEIHEDGTLLMQTERTKIGTEQD
jgi:DNA polymerase-3 subunit alpha